MCLSSPCVFLHACAFSPLGVGAGGFVRIRFGGGGLCFLFWRALFSLFMGSEEQDGVGLQDSDLFASTDAFICLFCGLGWPLLVDV